MQPVLDFINKVFAYLKTGFQEIVDSLNSILDYTSMRKHCLRFVGMEGDPYLENATNCEKQRQDLAEAIQINLDDTEYMADKFETDGIKVQEIGVVRRAIVNVGTCLSLSRFQERVKTQK